MPEADRTTPQTIRKKIRRAKKPAPRKAPAKKAYKLPQTFKTEAAADRPRKQKAGPPSPQITGRPTRKQPKRAPVRDRVSGKDLARGQAYVQSLYAKDPNRNRIYNPKTDKYGPPPKGTTVPPDVAHRVTYKQSKQRDYAAETARVAPALKVLEQTTRPLHAVAAAARANIADVKKHGYHPFGTSEGRSAARHAALRGIKNEDKSTASDVLGDLGWNPKSGLGKLAKTVVSTGVDIGTDPTTYVTGGTAAIAKKEALAAAKKAAKQTGTETTRVATRKEAARETARSAGGGAERPSLAERAHARKVKTGNQFKGVTVKFAGHDVPGVTKATAKAAKPVKKAAAKVTPTKLRTRARSVGADVNPNIAPTGVARETSRAATRATRTARAKRDQGIRRAAQVGHGIRTQIGEKNYNTVVDAIEAGKIGDLPVELRGHAVKLRSHFKHVRRVQRRAGVKVADLSKSKGPVKGYVYRQLTEEAAAADAKKAAAKGGLKPASSKARKEKRPLAEVRKADPGRYREDLQSLAAERLVQGTGSAAKSELFGRLADLGQTVKRGKPPVLAEGEAVYHIKAGQVPREVTDKAEVARASSVLRPNKAMKAEKKSPRVMYHVVRDSAVSKDLKLQGIRAEGLKPSSNGSVFLYDDLAQAEAFAGADGRILTVDVSKLSVQGANGAATRSVKGPIPASRIVDFRQKPKLKGATPKSVGAGRYVVLNRDIVKRAVEGASPTMQGPGIIHEVDKITAGFKRLAIGTIGFHVRNFIGDTNQAYIAQEGHRLPGNMRRAAKTLKATGKQDKATRTLTEVVPEKATLKTKRYGEVSYDEVAKRLFNAGAARSGYVGRELPELAKSGGVATGGPVRKTIRKAGQSRAGQAAKRFVLNREDLPRLTTAIDALRKGSTWEEAAQHVADIHFDYGHLTNFERQIARRFMPFYTWSARNIPFQTKHVIARPGKYANYQKVREEATKASGVQEEADKARGYYRQLEKAGVKLPKDWEKTLTEWEQRNAGIPISLHGQKFTESFGLPLQDLNEFPGAALSRQLDEWFQKGMSLTGPIPKDFVEYFDNHSFFFRDQLERDHSPLVAAPSYAKHLPGPIKKWAGVTTEYIDKKTGEKRLGWKGKADYVFKSVPGTPNYLQQFTTQGADRRGKGTVGKILAYSGVKSVPIDPVRNAVNLAYARGQEIQKRQAELRQTGVNAKNPTAEYTRLSAQLKIVNQIAFQGKAAQGYKVLPTTGGPPKIRSSSSRSSGGATDVFGRSSSGSSSGSGGTDVFGRPK